MCNILVFKANQMIDKESFWNMCHNNWHAWGLVVRKKNKLEVIRNIPENDEFNPQEVWDAVEENKQYPRYLHVRHITSGLNSEENCHPLEIYKDGDNQILFMHNGTLKGFKSIKMETNDYGYSRYIDDDSGPSDTRNFAEQVLKPMLSSDMGDGKANIGSPIFQNIVNKLWESGNRGLLITNMGIHTHLMINKSEWKEITATDGVTKVASANELYFKDVTRGPEKLRREEQVRLRQEEERKAKLLEEQKTAEERRKEAALAGITPLKLVPFREKHKFLELTDGVRSVVDSFSLTTRDGLSTLAYLSDEEIAELVKEEPTIIPWLISYLVTSFHDLHEDYKILETKKLVAEKLVSELKKGAA